MSLLVRRNSTTASHTRTPAGTKPQRAQVEAASIPPSPDSTGRPPTFAGMAIGKLRERSATPPHHWAPICSIRHANRCPEYRIACRMPQIRAKSRQHRPKSADVHRLKSGQHREPLAESRPTLADHGRASAEPEPCSVNIAPISIDSDVDRCQGLFERPRVGPSWATSRESGQNFAHPSEACAGMDELGGDVGRILVLFGPPVRPASPELARPSFQNAQHGVAGDLKPTGSGR